MLRLSDLRYWALLPVVLAAAIQLLLPLACTGQTSPSLTVWLIPSENAAPNDIARGEDISARVEEFNRPLVGTNLTVLNTVDPLAMKLASWNPEFAVPNASVVMSQKRTLVALQRFARANNVAVRVRFISWDEAFGLLTTLDAAEQPENYPDVVQIGTTWAAHFARERLIMSRPDWGEDRGNWMDVLDLPASVLPYVTDVRLLFYWKRPPSEAPGSKQLVLNTSSWQAVVESIRDQGSAGDTLVFPTGLTLNLLHDYFPLVRAGGGALLVNEWTGLRIDLTSSNALAVPEYLARNAKIEPRPGEPRRLITFPESTHEETSRLFVNGGYRATLEPANFIDRWRQDFEKRKPLSVFWYYVGAAVPPVAFKGGSELVVLRRTKQAKRAFALADFLATDPEYTEMLADVGHLPSCRPGYGIDRLVRALPGQGGQPGDQEFIQAVHKAIDQGQTYPDLDAWPIGVENSQVLEALQEVWRRTAEGDVGGLRTAARKTERAINVRVNWFYGIENRAVEAWELLTAILFVGAATAFYFYVRRLQAKEERLRAVTDKLKAEQDLLLLLHFNRAHRHDAAKFIGDNFHDLAERAKADGWPIARLLDEVRQISSLFRDKLAPYINQIADRQFQEMRGLSEALDLQDIVMRAFDGARYIFQARRMADSPPVRFIPGVLSEWYIDKMPYAVVVILEEWFLNCLRYVDGYHIKNPIISISVAEGKLLICSPGYLDAKDRETLTGQPSVSTSPVIGLGLSLIRDILYCAYASRAIVEGSEERQEIRLQLPLPLRPRVVGGGP
jgi:hypothetical protein